jgi:carbon storage regulator
MIKVEKNNEYGGLCLTRKLEETIVIGGNVFVTITKIIGRQVTLLIQAPKDISVNRQEIQDKIDNGEER